MIDFNREGKVANPAERSPGMPEQPEFVAPSVEVQQGSETKSPDNEGNKSREVIETEDAKAALQAAEAVPGPVVESKSPQDQVHEQDRIRRINSILTGDLSSLRKEAPEELVELAEELRTGKI